MEEVKEESSVDKKQQQSTRARRIRKVYGVDPLFCEKCGSRMKIVAVIMNLSKDTEINDDYLDIQCIR